ncbi:MAG: N-acetylmuramoyl-L-alanine amidase, partial [Burkholderiales bacterium]|nr:N-acetylmuramoyl-L-alanine amidase [Phycisphaerae bacterium]
SRSSTQIVYQINNGSDAGTWAVRVNNPGGQSSNWTNFTVAAPVVTPSISSVNPESLLASNDNKALTILGSNFVQGATLTFVAPGGQPFSSNASKLTFVSSGQIIYQFNSQSDVGTWTVRVNNPGGQPSNSKSFQVVAQTPALVAPTLQSATPKADGNTPGIELTWSAVANASNYKIYRDGNLIFSTATSGTTFWNTSGLVSGQQYAYQVQAVSGSTVSGLSNSIAAVAPSIESAPTNPNPGSQPNDIQWKPSPYHQSRGGTAIDLIVIHTVVLFGAPGSFNGNVSYLQNNSFGVSSHFVVGANGEIAQLVALDRSAQHAESWNTRSIGIEIVASAADPDAWTRDPILLQRLTDLVAWLSSAYNVPVVHPDGVASSGNGYTFTGKGIVGHYQVSTSGKTDPGSYFPWVDVIDMVQAKTGGTPNTAPTLTAIGTLDGAIKGTPLKITYDMLREKANEADVNGDTIHFRVSSVSSGTLTKNGVTVTPGDSGTLLRPGEELQWMPAGTGTVNAFAIKAWDGKVHSASAVQVKVLVTALLVEPLSIDFRRDSQLKVIGWTVIGDTNNVATYRTEASTDGGATWELVDSDSWGAQSASQSLEISGASVGTEASASAIGVWLWIKRAASNLFEFTFGDTSTASDFICRVTLCDSDGNSLGSKTSEPVVPPPSVAIRYVDGFDYPIGNTRPIPEFPVLTNGTSVHNEINNLYSDPLKYWPVNSPDRDLDNGDNWPLVPNQWFNMQDVGAFYENHGVHVGEDWNVNGNDQGKPVYAAATGRVLSIGRVNNSDQLASKNGWFIVLEHFVQGNNAPSYYSGYLHVAPSEINEASNTNGIVPSDSSGFEFQVGSWVTRGQQIAVIGDTQNPHLHFDMRSRVRDIPQNVTIGELYANDGYDGTPNTVYYTNGVRPSDEMGLEAVAVAYHRMAIEGFFDPSDFIDAHRPASSTVTNGNFSDGTFEGWLSGGLGEVNLAYINNANHAIYTTDSPVMLGQLLSTPDDPFTVSFDYQFLTTTGTLEVWLDSSLLGWLDAPAVLLDESSRFEVFVNDPALLGLQDVLFDFRFDGPTASKVAITNVDMEAITQSPAWLLPASGAVYTLTGNTLNVTAGVITLLDDAATTVAGLNVNVSGTGQIVFATSQHLGSLTLTGSASVKPGSNSVISVRTLNISGGGTFDLHNNALVIDYTNASSPYTSILNMLKSGLHQFGGIGTGIASSEVNAQSLSGTMLGVIDGSTTGGLVASLSGVTVTNPLTSILIKYTWRGDTNLDGRVNGSDYALADTGFSGGGLGWFYGDVNYDGVINGSDYALFDTGFSSQTSVL